MWLLLGLLGLLLVVYLGAPIVVFFLVRHQLPIRVVRVDDRELPQSSKDFFQQVTEQLRRLSFERVDTLCPALLRKQTVFVAFYRQMRTGDEALASFIVPRAASADSGTRYVEFRSAFTDGQEVLTNNSPVLGSFGPLPSQRTAQLPEVKDLARLYAIHRFQVDRIQPAGPPQRTLEEGHDGNAASYLAEMLETSLARQEPYGLVMRVGTGFRPTLAGAYRMTWQELPPMKQQRRARRSRNATELLSSFESVGNGGEAGVAERGAGHVPSSASSGTESYSQGAAVRKPRIG